MSEAVARIVRLERSVMWRSRVLSLQDRLALAIAIGGISAAVLVLLVRMRTLQIPVWILVLGALGVSTIAALVRSFFDRADERDAAFQIDESLGLHDRVATAHLVIARGGPQGTLEEALIEDAAERAGHHSASSVVPLRMRKWHALAPLSLIALTAALMVMPPAAAVNEAVAAERTDIDNAADHLERTASEVEQIVPDGTETAKLANEQGELGRGLRRSAATRADVLKRLSSLEDRIRRRHDELASTRADEIVTLADRQLGSALSTLSTAKKKGQLDDGKLVDSSDRTIDVPQATPKKENEAIRPTGDKSLNSASANKNAGLTASTDHSRPANNQPKEADPKNQVTTAPQNKPREPASGKDARVDPVKPAPGEASPPSASSDKTGDQRPGAPIPAGEKTAEQKSVEQPKVDQQPGEKLPNASQEQKGAADSLVNQAVRALPGLSEDLLKKAAQLRANELTAAEIEKLRRAAEALSRDLEQIAQSADLQRALQEMARQVSPEQIEQVARELGNQEKLKRELQSAARLLTDNQQAKEIAAGLAGELARARDEMRKQNRNEKPGGPQGQSEGRNDRPGDRDLGGRDRGSRSGAGKPPDKPSTEIDRRLAGQGRESSLRGKLQQGSRGEYLYLQTKAGAGAARAPYSSAYPQYRREAERSVQRTQVPPNLRSVVRKYFDAINPDSKR